MRDTSKYDRDAEIAEYVKNAPTAAWPWRLPIIRHVRWLFFKWAVHRHYQLWLKAGWYPTRAYLDHAVCDAIWRGEK